MNEERRKFVEKLRSHDPYPSWQQVFDDAADTIEQLGMAVTVWDMAAAKWQRRAERAERELAETKSLAARVADLERTRAW